MDGRGGGLFARWLDKSVVRIRTAIVATVLVVLACASCPRSAPPAGPAEPAKPIAHTAILGAFSQEVSLLFGAIEGGEERWIEEISFVTGTLRGEPVVITWSGIGKVNAAMTTTILLEHFEPSRVIFIGTAGSTSPKVLPGDVVIGAKTAQHDLGAYRDDGLQPRGMRNRLTGHRNPTFFEADPDLLETARAAVQHVRYEPLPFEPNGPAAKVVEGVIVTGDAFVMSPTKRAQLRRDLDADAVEMEGAAVAQLCYQRDVPFIAIRGISDSADGAARESAETYRPIAILNATLLVDKMIELMRETHHDDPNNR